jgi:hypothetical protein
MKQRIDPSPARSKRYFFDLVSIFCEAFFSSRVEGARSGARLSPRSFISPCESSLLFTSPPQLEQPQLLEAWPQLEQPQLCDSQPQLWWQQLE